MIDRVWDKNIASIVAGEIVKAGGDVPSNGHSTFENWEKKFSLLTNNPSSYMTITVCIEELVREEHKDVDLVIGLDGTSQFWAYQLADRLEIPFANVTSLVRSGVKKIPSEKVLRAVVVSSTNLNGDALIRVINILKNTYGVVVTGVVYVANINNLSHKDVEEELKKREIVVSYLTDSELLQ